VTYDPASDRILPSPQNLFVRVKNTAAIPLRAAYLHGPYTLHVAAYPKNFDPNEKVKDAKVYGAPQFEPNLKAGGTWNAKVPVPEEIRVSGSNSGIRQDGEEPRKLTWIVEVTSQIIFSSSASVSYEVLVSRDERSLDYSFAAISGQPTQGLRTGMPGQVEDNQEGSSRHKGDRPSHSKGVYSKAIQLVVDNTESLWNTPPFPHFDEEKEKGRKSAEESSRRSTDQERTPPRKKQRIHLVILTHGLHSNLSADMLYMKESIDQAAKEARENKKKRKSGSNTPKASDIVGQVGIDANASNDSSRDHIKEDPEEDGDEEIMVRGFTGNAVKTENGIQYLGKRMAKYILDLTYPDQPYKPIRRSMSEKLGIGMTGKKAQAVDEQGRPTHNGSTIRKDDVSNANLAYTFTKISFIGHSLGGLIQLYAIGYIQKHAPHFFDHIEPVNFVALATPFLGLSNENPMYIKFALDFGLVGRTGQDLGLTWKPPSLAKQGWNAMGFGTAANKDPEHPDPGAKPLLRILPTGPAHRVLRMFRNRTVYSNVVNDGIVPLRTSCLLFLDWKGLHRVEKARRGNGIIGTVANWGWSELTGASSSSPALISASSPAFLSEDETERADSEDASMKKIESTVPQPAEDETNQDYQEQGGRGSAEHHYFEDSRAKSPSPSPRPLDGLRNFLGLTLKTSKKDMKIYKRTQTNSTEDASNPSAQAKTNTNNRGRPTATRGDSVLGDPNANAPPKTSIFESAGDILNPPIPPQSWITDPSSRVRTIFHDRVYHPEDIPPPSLKRTKPSRSSVSNTNGSAGASLHAGTHEASTSVDASGMKVEEKIARAYHKDLSWRKVLVRLEPDAHNNMIVRRMFANAYGWPVVKHLCDTHFADTYAARTRDEDEPATDRAKGVEKAVGEHGEHVMGQEETDAPKVQESELRESADELSPLRHSGEGASTVINIESPTPTTGKSSSGTTRGSSYDSYDERYYLDNTDDEEVRPGLAQRLWSPPPLFGGGGKSPASPPDAGSGRAANNDDEEDHHYGTSQAEIADFLTSEPPIMEGHRGLEPVPMSPTRSAGDVGLRKSLETNRPGSKSGGISENVAKSLGSPTSTPGKGKSTSEEAT
jgi:hypothetical protein